MYSSTFLAFALLCMPKLHGYYLSAEDIHRDVSIDASETADSVLIRMPKKVGGYFGGDMNRSSHQKEAMLMKNGSPYEWFKWPNAIVPYLMSVEYNQDEAKLIRSSLDQIENVTCLRFVLQSNEEDYIFVAGGEPGCSSAVGRQGGVQLLNLNTAECMHSGKIIHEFIHALGFIHMISVINRDDYVTIMWENIDPEKLYNFQIIAPSESFGYEYDYNSIMHYDAYAFSENRQMTVIPKDPTAEIGKLEMSKIDIGKLNAMYCKQK